MARMAIAAALAVAAAGAMSGCGTFCNLLPTGRYMHVQWTETPRQVYGGVQLDGKAVWGFITELPKTESLGDAVDMAAFATYFAAVDLPLSAVMDTLTLYITVPATYRRLTDGPPIPGTPGKSETPPEGDNSAQPGP